MNKVKKLLARVLPLILITYVISCDIFAPYEPTFFDLSNDTLKFGLFEQEKQLILNYADSINLKWEIKPQQKWFKVTPDSGTITIGQPDTVVIKILRDSIDIGDYKEDVIIDFPNKGTKEKVTIRMEVKPVVNISVDSLTILKTDSTAFLNIKNSGNYPLIWSMTPDSSWIRIQPNSGTLGIDSANFLSKISSFYSLESKNDTTITVKVNNKILKSGSNVGHILFKSQKTQKIIKIEALKADAPRLNVSKNNLDFGEVLESEKITINNTGEELLTWSAASNAPWLKVTPTSGSFTSNSTKNNGSIKTKEFSLNKIKSEEIEISVDRSGLQPGQYNSSIDIKSNGGDITIAVTMKIPEVPVLVASPESLDFGKTELIKRIQISNSGTGKLVWSASSSASWISTTPKSDSISSGSQDLNISVIRLGLEPGDYSTNIEISSNGGSKTIPVKMTVGLSPSLSISPTILSFTNDKNDASFEIRNQGEGQLNWQLSTTQSWISISPSSGNTTTEVDLVNVSVNTSGLAPGSYNGSIKVTSDFNNETVQVTLVITGTAKLLLNPGTLDFGGNDLSKVFEIKNEGDDNLNWQLTTDQPWIDIALKSGVAGPNLKNDVEVKINRGTMPAGSYTGNINITSNGGSGSIKVTMKVFEDPKLSVNPTNLDFGQTENLKNIEIRNDGDRDLNWSLSNNTSWLTISSNNGTIGSKSKEDISFIVNRIGLTPGDYTTNIIISSNGGNATIQVTMKVNEAPKLLVNPTDLDFGQTENLKNIEIRNDGDGSLNWNLSNNVSWLKISSNNGTIGAKSKTDISITADRTGLTPGDYSTNIIISSNGGIVTIPVKISVNVISKLSVNVNSLNFGNIDSLKTLEITNAGSGELNWKATVNESWISVLPAEGIVGQNQRNNVAVSITRKNLTPGNYSATILITSNGGNLSISVSMSVLQKAVMTINPSTLDFGKSDNLKALELSNDGEEILNWSISTNASWLLVSEPKGSLAGKQKLSVNVNVNRLGLNAGDYSSNIIINSNGGNFTIPVKMNVALSPKLNISPTSLSFTNDKKEASFEIRNQGEGQLNWQVSTTQTWISVSPGSGNTNTEVDLVNVSVNPTGLAPGTFSGSIDISSDYGNESVKVTLVITGSAKLLLNPISLDFGGNDLSKFIEIKNEGNANLNWQLTADQPWLDIALKTGVAGPTLKNDVEVKINRGAMAAGSYTGNINITSNGGNGTIKVTMKVNEAAKLSVNPTILDFGQTENLKNLEIRNNGEADLKWSLSNTASWLKITSKNGTIGSKSKTDISITADRTGLNPGDYSTKIIISSNGGDSTVTVKMSIKDNSKLSINPNTFNFGEIDSSKTLEITNIGTNNLNWKATVNESWISVQPDSGTLGPNQRNNALVNITRKSHPPGNYSAIITIKSNGGTETVQVTMTIPEKPLLGVTSNLLDFGSTISSLSFGIRNKGTGNLTWKIEGTLDSWVSISPISGTTTTNESTINVNINRNTPAPGDYTYTLNVISNSGSETVRLKIKIEGVPQLSVSDTEINFGTSGSNKPITLQNIGTGTLTWTSEIMYVTTAATNWLSLDISSGSITNVQTMNITVNRTNLPVGQHNADIQIHSNGGNATIHLYVTVSNPILNVSTNLIQFNSTTEEKTFQISNGGSGQINWQANATSIVTSLPIILTPQTGTVTTNISTVTVKLQSTETAPMIPADGIIGTITIMVLDNNFDLAPKTITVKFINAQ